MTTVSENSSLVSHPVDSTPALDKGDDVSGGRHDVNVSQIIDGTQGLGMDKEQESAVKPGNHAGGTNIELMERNRKRKQIIEVDLVEDDDEEEKRDGNGILL